MGAEETISEAQDPINDSFDDNFMEVDEIPPPDQLEEPMVEPEIPAPAVQIEPQSPPRGRGEDGRSLRIPIYNARYNAYRRSLLGKVETELIGKQLQFFFFVPCKMLIYKLFLVQMNFE